MVNPRCTKVDHLIADVFAVLERKTLRVVSVSVNPADLSLLTSSDQYRDGRLWGASVSADVTVTRGTIRAAGENIWTGKVEAVEVLPFSVSS